MNRKLKLIWDFKGEDSLKTAEHHYKHLKEFTAINNTKYHQADFTKINNLHAIAFIIVDEVDMITYRDALKPHRGEIA